MAKDGPRAVLQKVEARLRFFFQAARQGPLSSLLAKPPKCLVERRAHVFIVGRLGPPNAVGDDVPVSSHGNGVQTSKQLPHLPIGGVDARHAD